jgi:hypothetical protein
MPKILTTVGSAYALVKAGEFDLLKPRNITQNFTWGEVFTGINERSTKEMAELKALPKSVYENAFMTALQMEKRRVLHGNKSIKVNSWVRVPSHNARVGGKPKTDKAHGSFHMDGVAVDYVVAGEAPSVTQKRVDGVNFGGLEYAPTWTHEDWRNLLDPPHPKARFYP